MSNTINEKFLSQEGGLFSPKDIDNLVSQCITRWNFFYRKDGVWIISPKGEPKKPCCTLVYHITFLLSGKYSIKEWYPEWLVKEVGDRLLTYSKFNKKIALWKKEYFQSVHEQLTSKNSN